MPKCNLCHAVMTSENKPAYNYLDFVCLECETDNPDKAKSLREIADNN
jgi:hypothetical protein